jgi:hypothetical protein
MLLYEACTNQAHLLHYRTGMHRRLSHKAAANQIFPATGAPLAHTLHSSAGYLTISLPRS